MPNFSPIPPNFSPFAPNFSPFISHITLNILAILHFSRREHHRTPIEHHRTRRAYLWITHPSPTHLYYLADGYAALMENPSGLPQGLDNASRCPHTHSPTTTKTFFSFIEMKRGQTREEASAGYQCHGKPV